MKSQAIHAARSTCWFLVLGCLLCPSTALLAAVITVNSELDGAVNLTDNVVTLRDAVQAANNDLAVSPGGQVGSGADTIQFANTLVGSTITLT